MSGSATDVSSRSTLHRKNRIDSQEEQIWFTGKTDSVSDVGHGSATLAKNALPTVPCNLIAEALRRVGPSATNGSDRPAQPAGGSGAGSTRNNTGKDRYSPRKSGRCYRQSVADYAGSGSIESKPIPEFVIVSKEKRLKEEERRPRLRPTPRVVTNDGGGDDDGGGDGGGGAFPSPSLRAAPASPRPPSR